MDKLRIFIGHDSRWAECSFVLGKSIKERATIDTEICMLRLKLLERPPPEGIGFKRQHDPLQSTEFTYTRFLVPYLCNYDGIALFMDSDMLCFADIKDILPECIDKALYVVKHLHEPTKKTKMGGLPQTIYPRKNWSSLMLMNCSKLKLWTKEFVEQGSGKQLHRFEGIPDEEIGELSPYWNCLDWFVPKTKILHYTSGGPWIDSPECKNHPYAKIWWDHFYRYSES
jgi:hypothetical protein